MFSGKFGIINTSVLILRSNTVCPNKTPDSVLLIALKLCYLIGSFIFAPQDIFNETSPETSQTSKRYADGGVYFTENLIINRGDLGDPIY